MLIVVASLHHNGQIHANVESAIDIEDPPVALKDPILHVASFDIHVVHRWRSWFNLEPKILSLPWMAAFAKWKTFEHPHALPFAPAMQ
jgi:hypothetical protein